MTKNYSDVCKGLPMEKCRVLLAFHLNCVMLRALSNFACRELSHGTIIYFLVLRCGAARVKWAQWSIPIRWDEI